MASIPGFSFTTEEDIHFAIQFMDMPLPLTGRTFSMSINESPTSISKIILTLGAGLTIDPVYSNILHVFYAKGSMTGWRTDVEYTADLIETTGGKFSRLLPIRLQYTKPGKTFVQPLYRSANVIWRDAVMAIASVGSDKGDKGEPGDPNVLTVGTVEDLAYDAVPTVTITGTSPDQVINFGLKRGEPGVGAPTNPDWLAQGERDDLLRSLQAAGLSKQPTLILDFMRNVQWVKGVYLGASIIALATALGGVSSITRGSIATYFDKNGDLQTAANHQPRLAYDPKTLEFLGYLRELNSTNYIPNNTFVGTTPGTPGSVPSGHSYNLPSGGGLTRQIVSTGVENGIEYTEIRIFGTPGANGTGYFRFAPNNAIPAEMGQLWTFSAFLRQVAGDASKVVWNPVVWGSIAGDGTSSEGSGASSNTLPAPNGDPLRTQRFGLSYTLVNAATGYVFCDLRWTVTSGVPIDFTVRIGLPQIEIFDGPSTPVKTSGSTNIRSTDNFILEVPSIFGPSEGTILGEYTSVGLYNDVRLRSSIGTNAESLLLRRLTNGGWQEYLIDATPTNVINAAALGTVAGFARGAIAYKASDHARSLNGGLAIGNSTAYSPPALRYLDMANGSPPRSAMILRRIMYFPQRISNAELAILSSFNWS